MRRSREWSEDIRKNVFVATEDQTWWEEEKTISARVEDHGGDHLEQWFFSWGSFEPCGHVAVLKMWPISAAAGWATGIHWGRQGMLLTALKCTGQRPQQRFIQLQKGIAAAGDQPWFMGTRSTVLDSLRIWKEVNLSGSKKSSGRF